MEKSYLATVRKCERERVDSDVFLLEIELSGVESLAVGPGQFIVLEPKNSRSVMPRPFSVVEVVGNVITVLIKAVGKNTEAYCKLKPGDEIKVVGPQGATIPIDKETASFILVGGGIGGAALTLLAKEILQQEKKLTVFLGGKKESQMAGFDFFGRYGAEISTVSESGKGPIGLVTDLLRKSLHYDDGASTVVACGPKAMLGRVAEICAKSGNRCLVILEEVMACGMGSCKGCAVFGKDGSVKHICSDGPAIDAEWVDWQKFIPTSTVKLSENKSSRKIDMRVKLGDLCLEYPTMNASGCLAIETLEDDLFDICNLGALVTKGVTVMRKYGNAMPRTCETPSGMINSIGLENLGLEVFIRDELPRWIGLGKPVFVNISGFSIEEYVLLAQAVNDTNAAGVEVNISCPNIKHGGITFGVDPHSAYQVTKAVRKVTDKLVIVKLTPNVTNIVDIAKAVVDGGADAVSLINTVQAMSINPYTRKPRIGAVSGGLSGPAVKPIAVRMVYQLFQAKLGVPIVGMGGIEDGESAAEFVMVGANMVAAGTGGFSNRRIFSQINDGLEKIIRHHGFSSIEQLTGSLVTD